MYSYEMGDKTTARLVLHALNGKDRGARRKGTRVVTNLEDLDAVMTSPISLPIRQRICRSCERLIDAGYEQCGDCYKNECQMNGVE